jgi:hypothetical protein
MEAFSWERMMMMDLKHRLRHLGLSRNGLNSKTVEALLEPLKTNMSLTSLDLSYNDLDHSKESNEALRTFLRCNSGLRYLDLCCNRLNADTFRELHLGLLENHTMLLLPLAGNPSVDLSPTIHLIQVKLREDIIIIISILMTIIILMIIIILMTIILIHLTQVKLRENRLAYKAGTQQVDCTFPAGGGGSVAYQSEEELGLRISISDEQARSALQLQGDSVDEESSMIIQQQIQSASVSMMITPTQVEDSQSMMIPVADVTVGQSTAVALTMMQTTDPSVSCESWSGESSPVVVPAVISDGPSGYTSTTPIAVAVDNLPPTVSGLGSGSGSATRRRNASQDSQSTSPMRPTAAQPNMRRVKSLSNTDLPPPLSGLLQAPINSSSSTITSSSPVAPDESFSNNTLNVLFSAPLAFVNRNWETVPLEVLDYSAERELLMQVFKEVHRDVSVHFDFATTEKLRTALTLGTCRILIMID